VGLLENQQDKTGICSMGCDQDSECGEMSACVALTSASKGCLRTCATSADCLNGYVCVPDPEGRGNACFVEPL
jgi:hypothetical protein